MPEFIEKKVNVLFFVPVVLWGMMVLVSIDHLYPFIPALNLTSTAFGYLAWSTFTVTIIALGYSFWKELVGVFFLYYLLGYSVGPFLEPPGDPLDHLRNTYFTCGKISDELQRTNKGLWQYSMLGNIICHERYSLAPKDVMQRIDIANGVFWATAASVLFVVGIRAGLPAGWAFFSVCLAFLFMGTNRFSYFSYYSFAPSFTSMWIFWLWIAVFFFQKQGRFLVPGILSACLTVPLLVVNHVQEAIFIALTCGVWVFLFLYRTVAGYCTKNKPIRRHAGWLLFLVGLFALLFILPQWSVFQAGVSKLFVHDYWQANQEAVVTWNGLHLMGKIWAYRIADTLGFFGFLPLLLIPLFISSRVIQQNRDMKWQVLFLGLLPFFIYCIPLLHYIWLSNCIHLPTHIRYYYRICYSSMFWLPLSLLLYNIGLHAQIFLPKHVMPGAKVMNGLFLTFCLLVFVVLSRIQSAPLYGKFDFITVDSRNWWVAWRPMIEEVVTWKKERIETDYITGYVLHAVFDVPLKYNQFNLLTMDTVPKRSIENMGENSSDGRIGCLINLHGFKPTWIPQVTGHWSPDLSQPTLLYQANDQQYRSLSRYLQGKIPGTCYVFY